MAGTWSEPVTDHWTAGAPDGCRFGIIILRAECVTVVLGLDILCTDCVNNGRGQHP